MDSITRRLIDLIQQSSVRLVTVTAKFWVEKHQVLQLNLFPHHPGKNHLQIEAAYRISPCRTTVLMWFQGDWLDVNIHIRGLDLAAISRAMHERYTEQQAEYQREKERLGAGHLSDGLFELVCTLDLLPGKEGTS